MIKTQDEIQFISEAGSIAAECISLAEQNMFEGQTGINLDRIITKHIYSRHAAPGLLSYIVGDRHYPYATCISINNTIIHGLPNTNKFKRGDVITIDVVVIYRGYYADTAKTFYIDDTTYENKRLIDTTENALLVAIDSVRSGMRVSELGRIIDDYVSADGFFVVRDFSGHGIGVDLHEKPAIPNYETNDNTILKENMVIAIEPMVTKSPGIKRWVGKDGWSINSYDGDTAAHFEHTILITKNGSRILTI